VSSPQVEQLKTIISNAQQGNEAAVTLLRKIAKDIVDAAPVPALVTIGQCIVSIGDEAREVEAGRN
jgi:hypothetical protein